MGGIRMDAASVEDIARIVRATRLGRTIKEETVNETTNAPRPINLGEHSVEEGAPVFAKGGRAGPTGRSKYLGIIEAARALPPHSDKERFVRVPTEPGTDSDRASNALRTALKRQGNLDPKEWKVRLLADGDFAIVRV